jgi:hypothetical protein
LKGDYAFDPDVITRRLVIEPTRVMRKADPRTKTTMWMLSSGKVVDEVVDVYAMSSKLVSRLAGSSESIKQLMAELRLSAVLQVVLRITMDDTKSMPAIGFDENTIKFLSNVGAFIDVDTYRNDT